MIGCTKPIEEPKEDKKNVVTPPKKEPQQKPDPKDNQPKPGKETTALKLGDYFPVKQGYSWKYLGEGNEYATFTNEVMFTKGNLAQTREDNGGSVTAAVYKTTEDAITRIFYLPEEYSNTNHLNSKPNDNLIILKAPLKVGTSWKGPDAPREIVDVNAKVTTPLGTYTKCIKVKLTYKDSVVNEYYNAGVGMVKQEFISGDIIVTSSLEDFIRDLY
jgi:hypothetical protein